MTHAPQAQCRELTASAMSRTRCSVLPRLVGPSPPLPGLGLQSCLLAGCLHRCPPTQLPQACSSQLPASLQQLRHSFTHAHHTLTNCCRKLTHVHHNFINSVFVSPKSRLLAQPRSSPTASAVAPESPQLQRLAQPTAITATASPGDNSCIRQSLRRVEDPKKMAPRGLHTQGAGQEQSRLRSTSFVFEGTLGMSGIAERHSRQAVLISVLVA
jgi:hypothetical protein